MPVLGDVAHPGVEHRAGARVRDVLAVEDDAPGRGVTEARDRIDQLRLAVGVDAGEPDDLASADGEADVANGLEPAVVVHVEVLDLEQRLPGMRGGLVDAKQHLASDHHPREPFLRRALRRNRVDELAAPQRRDPVGDLEHLVELVRDEDDRLALLLERTDDLEELLRLLRGQDGRRLVEHEDLGAAIQRLQDLDALLLADRDPVDARVGIDGEPVARRQLLDAAVGGGVVEQDAGAAGLRGEHDVLGHRHHRDEHEVLVHHPDSVLDRGLGRAQVDRSAVEQDPPLVRRVEPVEDVHQRRLAGAVLPEERVHFARQQIEVDVVVGEHSREPLRDPLEREDWCLSHAGRSYADRPRPCEWEGRP